MPLVKTPDHEQSPHNYRSGYTSSTTTILLFVTWSATQLNILVWFVIFPLYYEFGIIQCIAFVLYNLKKETKTMIEDYLD